MSMVQRTAAAGVALLVGVALFATPAQAKEQRARSSIIAGTPADISGFPYMAAVFLKGRMHCGGSVIAPTKVLTAAHCVDGFNPAKMAVFTGRSRLSDASTGQVTAVAAAVPHPDYKQTQVHDIGVITLASPVPVQPIGLPTAADAATLGFPGQLMRVAGWGARNPFGFNLAKVLKQTQEQIRSDARCRRAYRRLFQATAMICALGEKLKKFGRPWIHSTACSGDSGGPLIADTANGAKVIGTVSFGGAFCGLASAPTVYSRVSDSLDFIQSQL
jgi:secreted trypsin-like serine protease